MLKNREELIALREEAVKSYETQAEKIIVCAKEDAQRMLKQQENKEYRSLIDKIQMMFLEIIFFVMKNVTCSLSDNIIQPIYQLCLIHHCNPIIRHSHHSITQYVKTIFHKTPLLIS